MALTVRHKKLMDVALSALLRQNAQELVFSILPPKNLSSIF